MEEKLLSERINLIHDYFIEGVAENRGLENDKVRELATGIYYMGSQAKELDLVDELGGEEEVKAYLEKILEMPVELKKIESRKGFLEAMSGVFSKNSFFVGRGIGYAFNAYNMEKAMKIVS
jgi:protease-4